MNLQEAVMSNKYVYRKKWGDFSSFCYFNPNTGPYSNIVNCDYFVFYEDGFLTFSTTGPELYAEDILANDYSIFDITEKEIEIAKARSDVF